MALCYTSDFLDHVLQQVVQYVQYASGDGGDEANGHGTHVAGSIAGEIYKEWEPVPCSQVGTGAYLLKYSTRGGHVKRGVPQHTPSHSFVHLRRRVCRALCLALDPFHFFLPFHAFCFFLHLFFSRPFFFSLFPSFFIRLFYPFLSPLAFVPNS